MNRAAAVRISGLRYAYPGLSTWALDAIDLEIQPGEWLALVGANASGKTTLCRALVSLVPHLTGGRFQGQVLIGERDTRQHPPSALVDVVGLTFQNAESQLFNPSVEAEIVWGLEALGLPRAVIAERLAWALHTFHLADVAAQSPERLSGGQQRRLALAAVLAMQPSLLVLDAPLGGLDPRGRSEVLATLQVLRQQRHVTVVLAEADDPAVAAFADRVAHLQHGRLLSVTSSADVPKDAAARSGESAQLSAIAVRSGNGAQPGSAQPADHSRQRLAAGQQAPGATAAITLEQLGFAYHPGRPVLQDVSLTIAAGEFVALVGANGSGKTTLAKHLIGLLRPTQGRLLVQGQESARQSVGALARQVGFLFQNPERQIFSATVSDEVAFGPRNLGLPAASVAQRVAQALARFDLTELAGQPPAVLSFTQRRRVTLAAVAALETPILVLDEPTVSLDAEARGGLLAWLHERHAQGITLVLVTHDLALVADHAQRVLVMQDGRLVADGAPGEVLRQRALLLEAGLTPAPVGETAHAL
ncbi:MAG: ABC transporter ATP-binding protein [Anaerolineae bacterium]|nr:ABC transporter ATP-binding protein [Anaerolineae bacterium]